MTDKKRPRSDEAPTSTNGEGGDAPHEYVVDDAVEVVLVEPFYGGSHKQLVDLLVQELLVPRSVPHAVCTLPPRKWHWRLMASSLAFASLIPRSSAIRVLFVTSMVNLAELLGLRADLNRADVTKIYYFHENQLTYPYQTASSKPATGNTDGHGTDRALQAPRKVAAEDFQIGWSQVLSCLAADELVFNSDFNRTSFLDRVDAFINKIPEQELRCRDLAAQLRKKSRVLYFPLTRPPVPSRSSVEAKPKNMLTILWNHRWEYDKNPDDFFQTLFELDDAGIRFQVVVLGEAFSSSPPIFEMARQKLEASGNVTVVHWGFAASRDRYFELLRLADVVVSTSNHEFYGVAVLEAVLSGCYPLVPNRLVYPEFFSGANLFNTPRQLVKKLKYFCGNPYPARQFYSAHVNEFDKFTWPELSAAYANVLCGPNSMR